MVGEGRLPVTSLKPINKISTCKYNNALMIACAKASADDHKAIDNKIKSIFLNFFLKRNDKHLFIIRSFLQL